MKKSGPPNKLDPSKVVRAHQFLYYQGRAVWSDYEFDHYCRKHGIDGSGGSDSADSYTLEEKELAARFETDAASLNPLL